MATTDHIKFGDGLTVIDEGAGVIRVNGTGGPAGATGPQGPAGAAGATGPPGPSLIDGSTPTTLTGLLRGNGTDVDVAVAGTHYYAPGTVIADSDIPSAITRDSEMTAADALKVDKDSVVVAATRIVASKLVGTDAQPAFRVLGDGKHEWGAGGANVPDTNLYRSAASTLKTDGTLALPRVAFPYNGAGGDIVFQADTNLYRAGANTLKTDGGFQVVGQLVAHWTGGAYVLTSITAPGAGLSLAGDTNLYRASPGVLKTDGDFQSAADIYARQGNTAGQIVLSSNGIYFGTALDTRLYRASAGMLATSSNFEVLLSAGDAGAQFMVSRNYAGSGLPGILLGPGGSTSVDCALYRSGSNTLRFDGDIQFLGGLGTTNDTPIGINIIGVGSRRIVVGATDSAGAGYRSLRVSN